jgi:light-regulated signal transduction histidine kinase (bacteriophytochrome)
MMKSQNGLGREYVRALETYLNDGGEPTLSCAYELGRRALGNGLGILEVASLHHDALSEIVPSRAPLQGAELTAFAGDFFRELLSPFEMTLRGYRDASEQLRQLSADLVRQKQTIELVNKELESFSYSVSHDLRAPLRAIDGFSQALLEDYEATLDDRGKKYLRSLSQAAQRMSQLLDDLLGLARVSRGELSRIEVDLTGIAQRVVDELKSGNGRGPVEISIEEGLRAQGDPTLLAVVLQNLLGNAWKFTSKTERARIEFGKEEERDRTVYFVRDNGSGFNSAYARKLFGAFQRLHSSTEFPGTGIGLATVQRVVHRHGGQIWAKGEVNQGATFYFTLNGGRG